MRARFARKSWKASSMRAARCMMGSTLATRFSGERAISASFSRTVCASRRMTRTPTTPRSGTVSCDVSHALPRKTEGFPIMIQSSRRSIRRRAGDPQRRIVDMQERRSQPSCPSMTSSPGQSTVGVPLVRTEPIQERSAARIDALLDAAADVVDEIGFDRLTTAMVADRAGGVDRHGVPLLSRIASCCCRRCAIERCCATAALVVEAIHAVRAGPLVERDGVRHRRVRRHVPQRTGIPHHPLHRRRALSRRRGGDSSDDFFASRFASILSEEFGLPAGEDLERSDSRSSWRSWTASSPGRSSSTQGRRGIHRRGARGHPRIPREALRRRTQRTEAFRPARVGSAELCECCADGNVGGQWKRFL